MPGPTFLELARSIDRQLRGNIQYPSKDIVFLDSPYSIQDVDQYVNADTTGGNMVAILPDATLVKGMPFGIKKTDPSSNTVTVQTTGGQSIDSVGTKVLTQPNDFLVAVSDGANWKLYSSVITAAAVGGAVFYTIGKVYKTDGVTTLNPVNGTTFNFTVAVAAECFFAATGVFGGVSGLVSADFAIYVDGTLLAHSDFFSINGSGGDRTGPVCLEPNGSRFLAAGPHTMEIRASQTNLSLQASAADPLTLTVIYPGASLTSSGPTPKAATLVVHPTPGVGDYTTIQNALDNLPVVGGYILAREGTYAENLVFPDKPVVLRGCGDDTVLDLLTAAGAAFSESFNQPLTIEDMRVLGDGAAAQIVLDIPATVNGTKRIILNRVNSYDSVKTIVRNSGVTTPDIELKSSALRGWSVGWASAGGGTLILTDLAGNFGSVTGAITGTLITRNSPVGAVTVANSSVIEGNRIFDAAASSTNALVAIVPTITNPNGVDGYGTFKNTDGANSIDVKESFTDKFGTTSTLTTTVPFGTSIPLGLRQNIGTGFMPYTSYKVEVVDTVAGNHGIYAMHFTALGVV